MNHARGGGGGGATCMSLPFGKFLRRALLGGGGGRRKHGAKNKEHRSSSSVELVASASSLSSTSASWPSSNSMSSVVRVVLWSGVEEVYAGVVLACTVIRNHPPGLCLAHPDVFRNPHGARVRPLEPLLPGQKFFLLPETTVRKLQRDIPEASVGAFPFDDDEDELDEGDEEEISYTDMSSPSPSPSRSEGCCARDYFVNRERWVEWQFERMVVERGLANAEEKQNYSSSSSSSSSSSRRSSGDKTTSKKRRRRTKQRCKDLLAPPPPPSWGKALRAWEPNLPSVLEEAAPSSPESQTATTSPAQAKRAS